MRSRSSNPFFVLALLPALFPGFAVAGTVWEWNLTGAGTCVVGDCSNSSALPDNARKYTSLSGGLSVTATAWSNTYSNTTSDGPPLPTGTGKIDGAYLGSYGGGLGVGNVDNSQGDPNEPTTSPQHAMDNDKRYDSILFDFGQKLLLTEVSIGYSDTKDSDITVFAYLGSNAPLFSTQATPTQTYASLISDTTNWKVTSYSSTGANGLGPIPISGTQAAQYYLVASYVGATSGNMSAGNDYLKVSGVKVTEGNKVPEPHVLMLLAFTFAGIWTTRRSQTG